MTGFLFLKISHHCGLLAQIPSKWWKFQHLSLILYVRSIGQKPNLRLADLDALVDEEPHDLGGPSSRRVVQGVVAPLGAGVEVGAALQQQLQDVDAAVVS